MSLPSRPVAALLAGLLCAACSPGGAGSLLPGIAAPVAPQQRGAVEAFVKTNHVALSAEIAAGAGPTLERAFDVAGVPLADRPARRVQLGGDAGLYAASPAALVAALLAYGGGQARDG